MVKFTHKPITSIGMNMSRERGFESFAPEDSKHGVSPQEGENPSIETEDRGELVGRATPDKLRERVDGLIKVFCKEFKVAGEGHEMIEDELLKNPDAKFVIAASHFSNLDAPSAVKALGDVLDIQVTAESVHFEGGAPQKMLFGLAGAENFSPLAYEKGEKGKHGVFDPKNFEQLAGLMEGGKTPWMAVHAWTTEGEMQQAKVGAVYLAHKTGAKIIPSALEYVGGSVNLEGGLELAKALIGRAKGGGRATYHVGKLIDLPHLDVSIIDTVFEKRAKNESITSEERQAFSETLRQLREQAQTVAQTIADMLPDQHRGAYGEQAAPVTERSS